MENYTTMNLDQMSKNGSEFFNPSDSEPLKICETQ